MFVIVCTLISRMMIYLVMSVVQGGCRFSFLAEPVFKYLVDGSMKGNIPDSTLCFIMDKVSKYTIYYTT